RWGISSDWIGGKCAPTHTTRPTVAIAAHSDSTKHQYIDRPRLSRARDLDRRRFALLSRGLRSRGGGGGSSSSSSSTLRAATGFFGFPSADGMRSLGSRRKSASAAASPKRGSLRPPLFFRLHAIPETPSQNCPLHANVRDLRSGYGEINALLGAERRRDKCRFCKARRAPHGLR